MKLEHLLIQYFYTSKELSLQGIGKFFLSQDLVLPPDTEKEVVMPENAIGFEYNIKSTEDEGLISYIVENTKKIRPLASADLDSFLTLGKQFLNIGKPFKIEGIGTLEKKQTGEYQFTQGVFTNTKAETVIASNIKEKADVDISFASVVKETKLPKKALSNVALVAIICLVGFGIWYFISHQQSVTPATVPKKEATEIEANSTNSPQVNKDSVTANPNITVVKDSFTFKVVLKNYPNFEAANKSFLKLTSYGHKLKLYTRDSITYKIAMPFTKPLSDTAYLRDSIRQKLFGGNPYIEIN